jgi:hypothetical protein
MTYYKYVGSSSWGLAYFLSMVGAAMFYIQQAASFGDGVPGVLKALIWPAFLVYHLLGL